MLPKAHSALQHATFPLQGGRNSRDTEGELTAVVREEENRE
jgi:hypothetical protein